MKLRTIATAGLLVCVSLDNTFAAPAQPTSPTQFVTAVQSQFVAAKAMCDLVEGGGNGAKTEACIREKKTEMSKRYRSLLRVIGRRPDALRAAKAYYAGWLTAMDGVPHRVGEVDGMWQARQDSNDAKLDALSNALLVELQ